MSYSDAEVGEALIALAFNKFDFKKTSEESGIPIRTLREWANKRPKKGVKELLERALERALMRVDEVPAESLPIFIGILADKWLLASGESTERTEQIFKSAWALSDEERAEVLAEAQRILDDAKGSRASSRNSKGRSKS